MLCGRDVERLAVGVAESNVGAKSGESIVPRCLPSGEIIHTAAGPGSQRLPIDVDAQPVGDPKPRPVQVDSIFRSAGSGPPARRSA